MTHIKALKGFMLGDRFRSPDDPPFPVDDRRAQLLVKEGLACVVMPIAVAGEDVLTALNPGPARAQKSVQKRA